MTESENPVPNPIWEADSTHPEKAAEVRQALRQVMDPEIGMSVVELGLVRQASFDDTKLKLDMIMTTPFCPYAPALLEATRSKAEEASGMETTIDMGMDPWDPSMMEEGAGAAWGIF
ncbi:MAG TPA: iron-sulfur cluster assembly protein [Anaerolineales bacterium]